MVPEEYLGRIMSRSDEKLLRLEVDELTELLRHDEQWSDLRLAIASKGVDVANTMLAGFFEDEQSRSYGVLAPVDDDEFIEFQMSARGRLTKWTKTLDVDRLLESFPAVKIAIEMRDKLRNS